MTAKQIYTLVYRELRRTHGAACFHNTKVSRTAWKTWEKQNWNIAREYDPTTIPLRTVRDVYFAWHFSSDYRYSKVGKS